MASGRAPQADPSLQVSAREGSCLDLLLISCLILFCGLTCIRWLLFGSTWMVNSIVFFAILVMILLSNLFVILCRPMNRWRLYYGLLIGSLLVSALVPMDSYLSLAGPTRMIVACTLAFLPVFFAGIIFALAFRESRHPDIDIGSNILGVILGGLSEYLSLMTGFNSLLILATAYYVLSALLARRSRSARLAAT